MCDLPEEEQAEFELWAEYARARATARARRPGSEATVASPPEVAPEPATA